LDKFSSGSPEALTGRHDHVVIADQRGRAFEETKHMNRTRKSIAAAAALGSVLTGGAVGMLALGGAAHAADSPTTTSGSTAASTAKDTARAARGTETPLTGDQLAKATAAAQAAAAGATIVRAETDADGDAFEVHITNADGTKATVKLNADFTVRVVEADKGRGGKGSGGPHQANGITETPLTGDELAKATAAAQTAAPGATVVRAETDGDGDAFEVHITKADGTKATVKLNSDFTVKTVDADQGHVGGKGGGHGRHGKDSTATTTAPATS
jgi:uncharacterized membrane protein YkoI